MAGSVQERQRALGKRLGLSPLEQSQRCFQMALTLLPIACLRETTTKLEVRLAQLQRCTDFLGMAHTPRKEFRGSVSSSGKESRHRGCSERRRVVTTPALGQGHAGPCNPADPGQALVPFSGRQNGLLAAELLEMRSRQQGIDLYQILGQETVLLARPSGGLQAGDGVGDLASDQKTIPLHH